MAEWQLAYKAVREYYEAGRRPRRIGHNPCGADFSGWTFWEPAAFLEQHGVHLSVYDVLRSTVEGNHVATSYHYAALAIDLIGSQPDLARGKALLIPYAQGPDRVIDELIYNDGTTYNYFGGRPGGRETPNHYDHMHIAMHPCRHLISSKKEETKGYADMSTSFFWRKNGKVPCYVGPIKPDYTKSDTVFAGAWFNAASETGGTVTVFWEDADSRVVSTRWVLKLSPGAKRGVDLYWLAGTKPLDGFIVWESGLEDLVVQIDRTVMR